MYIYKCTHTYVQERGREGPGGREGERKRERVKEKDMVYIYRERDMVTYISIYREREGGREGGRER